MKIVFATNNAHKLSEVRELLGNRYEVVSPAQMGITDEVEETATTLEGNALLKARALYEACGVDCFADDTGLEVEVLNGEPGVRSARYATDGHDYKANNELLLKNMERATDRSARFRTAIALIINGEEHLFEGIVTGEIATAPQGEEGFGYDPLFIPEGHTQSFAQMSIAQKGSISHRGRAVAKLVDYLKNRS